MRGKKNSLGKNSRKAHGIYQNPMEISFAPKGYEKVIALAEAMIEKPINMQHHPSYSQALGILKQKFRDCDHNIAYAEHNLPSQNNEIEGLTQEVYSLNLAIDTINSKHSPTPQESERLKKYQLQLQKFEEALAKRQAEVDKLNQKLSKARQDHKAIIDIHAALMQIADSVQLTKGGK